MGFHIKFKLFNVAPFVFHKAPKTWKYLDGMLSRLFAPEWTKSQSPLGSNRVKKGAILPSPKTL